MLRYFYGSDTYAAQQAIIQLTSQGTAAAVYVDREDIDRLSLREILSSSPSLFGATLYVLRDPSLLPASLQNEIVELVKSAPNLNGILWDRVKTDKRTAMYAALKKYAQEFGEPTAAQAGQWAVAQAQERGAAMDSAAAQELIARVGVDRWRLLSEIEKLALRLEKITVQDVQDNVVAPQAAANPFAMLDAITSGQRQEAMRALDTLLLAGESELSIMGLLAWQVRTLLTIAIDVHAGLSAADIAKTRGFKPFVVQKGIAASRRFSVNFLLDALSRIMATDFAAKQGRTESFRTALVMLVLGLLEQQKTPLVQRG
jgi:DNA polymerase-3 subunit delta